ncbi:Uncharacterised protein [uncultured archaeon]|nr:Uncharacterised protein [uncultured archaeon]
MQLISSIYYVVIKMKIIKFEGSQIDEIEQELLDAKENGKDVIYIEKEPWTSYKTPVYLSGITEIEKDKYHGRSRFGELMHTNVIKISSKSSQDFNRSISLCDSYDYEQICEEDFLVIGYRALLQDKFKKIGRKCEVGESPIRIKYRISG